MIIVYFKIINGGSFAIWVAGWYFSALVVLWRTWAQWSSGSWSPDPSAKPSSWPWCQTGWDSVWLCSVPMLDILMSGWRGDQCVSVFWLILILKREHLLKYVWICLGQHTVEVLNLLSDDVETDDAGPGENLKLRLKGIEEEEILPGFILCSPENVCHSGRTFDAQVKTSAAVTQLPRVGLHAY